MDAFAGAFSRIHRGAFGVAAGTVLGLAVFLLTVFHVVRPAGGLNLALMAQYFYGYEVSWTGAFVGASWGGLTGFVTGWLVAFVRNLAVSASLVLLRARADLSRTNDFLDHI